MDALITEAKNGDKEAFVRLIRMNKQSLYKTAWIYLRDEQDIADALQNTILSCYENIQRLREPKYFKTWLMRILINECKDILRQKNHAAELDDFAEGVHCEELISVNGNNCFYAWIKKVGKSWNSIILMSFQLRKSVPFLK